MSHRIDEVTMDEIKTFSAQMGANDWKERLTGIRTMRDLAVAQPDAVGNHIVKVGILPMLTSKPKSRNCVYRDKGFAMFL